MMKNNKRKIKISPAFIIPLIAVALALALSIGAITYAAYTNSRHAQRTIATYDATGDRFSSNALAKLPTKDNVRTLYVTYDPVRMSLPTTVVTVCNYQQGKQTLPFGENISYTLVARLVRFDDSTEEKYVPVDAAYMTANSLTGYSITLTRAPATVTLNSNHLSDNTFSGTLTGDQPSSDAYTLVFGDGFAQNKPNLYIEMIATPSIDDLPVLRGVFKAEMRSQGANNSWQGVFSDDTSSSPNSYAAYNYQISGMGSGTFTFRWDATKVSLNFVSLRNLLAVEGATQDGNSITIPVDSDVESKYDIIFNRVNITDESWLDMNNAVVTFTFR